MSAPNRRQLSTLTPAFRRTVLLFVALVLGYTLLTFFFRGRAAWYPGAAETFSLVINLAAAAALAYAARQSRNLDQRVMWAWRMLAIAQLVYFLGDITLAVLSNPLGEVPYPSLADGFYLLYYPLFIIGLLLLPIEPLERSARLKIILDLSIVTLSALLLGWNFIFAPIIAQSKGDLWPLFVSLAYPTFDLLLFLVLMRMLFHLGRQFAPSLILLQAGVGFAILGDTRYALDNLNGVYLAGSLSDLLLVIYCALVGLAGAWQAFEQVQHKPRPKTIPLSAVEAERKLSWLVYLPYFWGWLVYVLLIFHKQVGNLSFSVLAAGLGLIFFMVMLRQIVSFEENANLFDNELRRRRLAEALSDAARTLTTNLDHSIVPGIVLEQLATVVPYERCSIMLQQEKFLYIAAQRGFPEDERVTELRIPIKDDDVFLDLCASRQPIVLDDVTQVPGWSILPWLPLNKSWMGVPLVVRDSVIGMISLTRPEVASFSASDAAQALAFAGQAAAALENARLYSELSQAYRTVEVMDRTKSSFIEVVAHELRTPLTVIKGYTQTLSSMKSMIEDPVCPSLLDGITRGMERMHAIVNNMLDVTRIENQVLQLNKVNIKIYDLFMRVSSGFEKALADRKLTLTISDEIKNMPLIQGDPELLHKVCYQVVMNAIKYTPDGGKISVDGQLDLQARQVEIVVSDTGIGIDPAQLNMIFEKFYQTGQVALHSSSQTKFKGGGPGLGLPIARGIVTAHGGKIWVESPGHDETTFPGSQFHIRLPI